MVETVNIESLAYGGDGIGRLSDGRTVFVARTCPGDVASVRVVEVRERFARGELAGLEQPSEARVEALCPEAAAGRCGGCPWAHVAYEEQLRCKRRALSDALVRIAGLDAEFVEGVVAPCVPSERQWGYRNKLEFDAGTDAAGHFALGMHAAAGPFTPLVSCKLCGKKFQKAPKALTGALRYIQRGQDLGIERVGLRVSERTGDVEVAVWTRTGRFPRAKAAKVLADALPAKRAGLVRVLLKGQAAERKVSKTEVLAGHGAWTERVGAFRMRLSAPSFFQVNTSGAEKLVELVLDGLEASGLDSVVDLYAGAGTFTLPLAREAMNVAAVESFGPAVRDLRANLEDNRLYAEVLGGDAARELPGLGPVDAVVVDPPRSGLAPRAVDGLLASQARRIAYVSCNPATLARDLKALIAGGYRLKSATPVDLFPQTYHVETVAHLAAQRP